MKKWPRTNQRRQVVEKFCVALLLWGSGGLRVLRGVRTFRKSPFRRPLAGGEMEGVWASLPFQGILVCTNTFGHEAVEDAGIGGTDFVVLYK